MQTKNKLPHTASLQMTACLSFHFLASITSTPLPRSAVNAATRPPGNRITRTVVETNCLNVCPLNDGPPPQGSPRLQQSRPTQPDTKVYSTTPLFSGDSILLLINIVANCISFAWSCIEMLASAAKKAQASINPFPRRASRIPSRPHSPGCS